MIHIGILSLEQRYSEKIACYLSSHLDIYVKVIRFSNQDTLKEYLKMDCIEILLTDIIIEESLIDAINSKKLIDILYLGEVTNYSKQQLCKYQSCEDLYKNLKQLFPQYFIKSKSIDNDNKDSIIIGIYSPVHGCLKTSLAVVSGIICNQEYGKRVLLISMDSYSYLRDYTDDEIILDLSDLIFAMVNHEDEDFRELIEQAIVRFNNQNLEYIIPPITNDDLYYITGEKLLELLIKIRNLHMYDVIVLDVAAIYNKILSVLEVCNKIFIPQVQGDINQIKMQNFKQYLLAKEKTKILEHFVEIKLREENKIFLNNNYFNQLVLSYIGENIKKELKCLII